MPSDQMSLFRLVWLPNTSGAIYFGVPVITPRIDILLLTWVDRPKSPSFTQPASTRKMLSGLISYPLSCYVHPYAMNNPHAVKIRQAIQTACHHITDCRFVKMITSIEIVAQRSATTKLHHELHHYASGSLKPKDGLAICNTHHNSR